MNDFTLDDFKIGEVYGFMVANDQGEVDEIEGCVVGYTSTQLGEAHSDLLMIKNIFSERPTYVDLDSIKNYYHVNRENPDYVEAEVYNPELDEYNIERGSSVRDIISIILENWVEKYIKFRNQIKSFIPKGYDKILDALIFDVCGFGR